MRMKLSPVAYVCCLCGSVTSPGVVGKVGIVEHTYSVDVAVKVCPNQILPTMTVGQ